jgi:acyl-CoA synthetase (AMP-forming)/AMP-acid ligase II
MKGTMMQFSLTLAPLLERARKLFPTVEVVSSRPDNSIHRYTYREMHQRARVLAAALQALGLRSGDRVATLMSVCSTRPTLATGLTLASDFSFCFQCQAGSSLVLRRPIEITELIRRCDHLGLNRNQNICPTGWLG